MKAPTEKQRQWLWFAGLWCGGLFFFLLLSAAVRILLASAGIAED